MKNQYFGDVGDFGKYGLLSVVVENSFSLGINWYLTEDDERTDGKFINYLDKQEFRRCDEELHKFLALSLANGRRHVNELKHFERFHRTAFYDSVLFIDDINALSERGRIQRLRHRNDWFMNSMVQLKNCDLIFCDPDNGLETESVSPTKKESVKYTFLSEIDQMLSAGKSVVVYNHRDRTPDNKYKERLRGIHKRLNTNTKLRVIRFNRYNVRDYMFFIQTSHAQEIEERIDKMLNDRNWNRLFKEYPVY